MTDPWLRNKTDFQVEQVQMYEGRDEKVASLFMPCEKKWNTTLVRQNFVQEDADAILETCIPQRDVVDQVVWVHSSNGAYTAKRAYHFWYKSNIGLHATPSCVGWKRIWQLNIPQKIKVLCGDIVGMLSQFEGD